MSDIFSEANYENAIIDLFQSNMGYDYVYGPDIDRNFSSPLYDDVLEESLRRLNPKAPYDAIQDALLKLRNFENGELVQKNAVFMDYLQNGVPVRYTEKGEERSTIRTQPKTPLSSQINGLSLRMPKSAPMLLFL